jgi:hypothetical protein
MFSSRFRSWLISKLRWLVRVPASHRAHSKALELTKGRFEMTSRTIHTVGILTGATLACSAMAQTTIYTCNFDVPPYAAGTINAQQKWTTAQAAAIVAVPEMAIVTSGGPGAQAGNGFFSSTNGPNSSTSGRFAFQAFDYPAGSAGTEWPLIKAIKDAEAAGSTSVEFSVYISAPTPALSGTSNVNARHGMVLYTADPTGASTLFKAAVGFQVRAFDRQVFVVQWLDVGQLGVGTAGNYLINFTTPFLVEATGYTQIGCRWNRETGMPAIKVGAAEWTDVVATSTVGWTADEFDIVNTRGSATGGLNTVSTTAYMDSLVVAAAVPAYPQCNTSAGDCDVAHPSGGCNIITCCETVCNLNSACCDVEWDAGCVDIAIPECQLFVYSCSNPSVPAGNCAIQPNVLSSLPATVAYDTTQATTDGPPEVGCGSSKADLPIHKDVWYRIQAATNGTLIASNCNGGGFGGTGNFDSKIAAYDLGTNLAAFDPQTLPDLYIGCNEDCAEDGAGLYTSTLNQSGIVAGHYYLVRLGGYLGQSGSGNLYVNVQPPPNPCDPANLIQGVAGSNVVTVDTLYEDLDFAGSGCDFPLGDDKIYNAKFIKFTPTASGTLEVENCSDTGTEVDARIAVLTQCGVVSSVIGCDDDGCTAGAAPYTSRLEVAVSANTTYYIAVGGFDDGQAGPFNVNIIPPAAPACPADLNQDGTVNGADLGLLLGSWGACPGCAADLNADGVVNGADLGLMLGSWGACV